MNLIVQLIISTLAVLITAYFLPGIHIDDFKTAILVALVLGILNSFVKPLLIFFSLPAVIFSFGLFLIVINIFIILLADKLVDGFRVDGWLAAFFFSLVMWIVTGLLNSIKRRDEQTE